MAQFAALVKFWPYNLSLTWPTTLQHGRRGLAELLELAALSVWVATLGAA
jgi:hypothetical protein